LRPGRGPRASPLPGRERPSLGPSLPGAPLAPAAARPAGGRATVTRAGEGGRHGRATATRRHAAHWQAVLSDPDSESVGRDCDRASDLRVRHGPADSDPRARPTIGRSESVAPSRSRSRSRSQARAHRGGPVTARRRRVPAAGPGQVPAGPTGRRSRSPPSIAAAPRTPSRSESHSAAASGGRAQLGEWRGGPAPGITVRPARTVHARHGQVGPCRACTTPAISTRCKLS
jgi:hypothetical protein